jgi:hypothetical protein
MNVRDIFDNAYYVSISGKWPDHRQGNDGVLMRTDLGGK